MNDKCVELLAPAGSLDRLKVAIEYGADAVYIGGEEFSLRAAAENFTEAQMKEGIEFAHARGKKVYVALNIMPHNDDLARIEPFVKKIHELSADAVIVSDLGVMNIVKKAAPGLDIHISTQASVTNFETTNAYFDFGAKRVVLARELSLSEISQIAEHAKGELEVFVHGAMCVSYSGRCLISNYLADRDGNMGACAQPCRWKYYLMEEKRRGEFFPVAETEGGTFLFNSKDLCMIDHVDKLIQSGVTSLKIEGRVKTSFYVATVVKAYRAAIDAYFKDPENYTPDPKWAEEVCKVSHREYCTGFFFGKPSQVYADSSYIRDYELVARGVGYDKTTGIATLRQQNKFLTGDEVEFISPNDEPQVRVIEKMYNEDGDEIQSAPHAQMTLKVPTDVEVTPYTFVRKRTN